MAAELFDSKLRAIRLERAKRLGAELFLHERAFADCLERIALIQRRFRCALLIGCREATWAKRLGEVVDCVCAIETIESQTFDAASYDLCVSVGELDTVNDLPRLLLAIRAALQPDSLLIGALPGGDSLPRLRAAMRAADEARGAAAPHVHPRIEASALAALLSAAGFAMPVVDVDRVQVSYASLDRLVGDLRRMAATNVLQQRPRQPVLKAGLAAARAAFAAGGDGERTIETFEILHFAAWTGAPAQHG